MINKNRRKFVIVEGATSQEVDPANDYTLEYTWEREEGRMYYNKKLKTELKLVNTAKTGQMDFNFLYAYESDVDLKCTQFRLLIYKKCNGNTEQLEYEGKFSLTDCEWDLDRCSVVITTQPDTIYQCIKENKNEEFNLLNVLTPMSTTANLSYNYEFDTCLAAYPGTPVGSYTGPNPGTFATFHQDFNLPYAASGAGDCDVNHWNLIVKYREYVVVPCLAGLPNPPANGTGWVLEEDNCDGTGTDPEVPAGTCKYVRFPEAGNMIGENPNVEYGFANPGLAPPPQAVYKNIDVTATPSTPPIKGYLKAQSSAISGTGSDWTFEVYPNPNSTYNWTQISGLPFTITSGAGTNKITGFIGSSTTGSCTIQVEETHGNLTQSYQTFTFLINPGFPANNNLTDFISGPTQVCYNQDLIKFRIPDLPISTDAGVTVTGPVWSVNNGATIVSGQGTTELTVEAGTTNFDVQCNWGCNVASTPSLNIVASDTFAVVVSKIPVTPEFEGIFSLYPNEPGIVYTAITRPGATYQWIHNASVLGTGSTFSFSPELTSDTCLHLKEAVDCGCDFQEIYGGGPFGIFPPIYWCPDVSTGVAYTRGRLFQDVCEYIIDQIGCEVNEVVSDFFEWNAIGDTPGYVAGTNYVTGDPNELLHLSLHEKSDVLDPTTSNPATLENMTFEMLEKIWQVMFNCYWMIDSNNNLRIEHRSWFFTSVNYDSTVEPHKEYNVKMRKYRYDKIAMPKYERFRFSESYYPDFVGADIYYDSPCVNQDSDNNREENVMEFLTTDLYSLYLFPDNASLTGWVMMCNDYDGVNYSVAVEEGKISLLDVANGHLSWANLHYNYHRHDRVLLEGYMNNTLTTFFSKRPTRTQNNISLKICCEDFEPNRSFVKTELGDGIIKEATLSTQTGVINTTIQHD